MRSSYHETPPCVIGPPVSRHTPGPWPWVASAAHDDRRDLFSHGSPKSVPPAQRPSPAFARVLSGALAHEFRTCLGIMDHAPDGIGLLYAQIDGRADTSDGLAEYPRPHHASKSATSGMPLRRGALTALAMLMTRPRLISLGHTLRIPATANGPPDALIKWRPSLLRHCEKSRTTMRWRRAVQSAENRGFGLHPAMGFQYAQRPSPSRSHCAHTGRTQRAGRSPQRYSRGNVHSPYVPIVTLFFALPRHKRPRQRRPPGPGHPIL